jgi:hypothetical protein
MPGLKPGVVVQICNLSTQEGETHKFEVSLGYSMRLSKKKKKEENQLYFMLGQSNVNCSFTKNFPKHRQHVQVVGCE